MNYRSFFHWWTFSLMITTFSLITSSKGESISLIVEGEVSLIGPICPGTVSLSCERVELSTSLRWRYNRDINIISYFPDSSSTTQSPNTAFFTPQLVTVERDPNDLNIANFSSSLTVDGVQLIANNVTEISCGAPGVSQAEPVNVTSIIEPGVPNSPTITMVTAVYQSGELNSVEVTWEKSNNFCPSFGLSFIYEVNLTASDSIQVNHLSCGKVLCNVSFENVTEEYSVSIEVENELGSSDVVVYSFSIARLIQQNFNPEVFSNGRQLFGRCTTAPGFVGSAMCSVQYTTDSMYRDLPDETIGPLNTDFSLVENPVSNTTYYFQFSVQVNNTLEVTERIFFVYLTMAQEGIPGWGIAVIVIAVVLCLAVLTILAILLIRRTKKRSALRVQTVSVEDFERKQIVKSKFKIREVNPYTAYKVVIKHQDTATPTVVYRSYKNFENLYKQVKKTNLWEKADLQFPSTAVTNLEFPVTDTRNQECQEKLNKFIGDLMEIPNIRDFSPVQEFLFVTHLDPELATFHLKTKK